MPVGGGQSLGNAQARLSVDDRDLDRIEVKAKRVGVSVRNSLGVINTGAKQAQGGIAGLSGSINNFVKAYGLMQVATTTFSLGSLAATNERTRASFDKLAVGVGSSGNEMLAALQKTGRGAISNSELILAANQAILLGAANTTEEITQLLEVARVRGQAVGMSFTESVTRVVKGVGKLEPEGLDELGLAINLVQVFDEYAASLNRTAQSLTQAEKRTALFNKVVRDSKTMVDAAKGSADDTATEFERLAAAFLNAKDSAGQFLLTIGLPETVETFTRAIKDSAEWLEMLARKYRQIQAFFKPLTDPFSSDPNQQTRGEIANLRSMQTGLMSGRADLQRDLATGTGQSREMTQAALVRQDALLAQVNAELTVFSAKLAVATKDFGAATSPYAAGLANNARVAATAPGVGGRTDAQVSLIKDWAAGVRSIEKDANSARLDATQSYESQRSETIRSYEQSIARDAQDFAISRARAAKQLAATIAEIQSDAGKREADWQTDLNESVATIQTEGNDRIADIQRDYERSRERAEANHRETLFSAAARLDAVAVANEQRQFAKSSREAEVDYHDRLTSEQANLQERIQQEQDAHRVRLEDAREADRQRIADAVEALAESQLIEDQDRQLRLERQAIDHQDQLAQMAVAQGERLAQISRHAAEERAQLDEEFKAALEKEGVHNKQWLLQQIELRRLAEQQFDLFWGHITDKFEASILGPLTKAQSAAAAPVGVDPGWFSGFNQPIPKTTRSGATGTAGRTNVLNIASGAIIVNAAPGMSPELIADAVNTRLLEHYKAMAN